MVDQKSVTVKIYGQSYTLRGDTDENYVLKVASLVDQKMKEVAANSNLIVVDKVAILAAVNLADELLRERHGHSETLSKLEDRVAQAADFLDKELERL
jgi:cell division protein ZapA